MVVPPLPCCSAAPRVGRAYAMASMVQSRPGCGGRHCTAPIGTASVLYWSYCFFRDAGRCALCTWLQERTEIHEAMVVRASSHHQRQPREQPSRTQRPAWYANVRLSGELQQLLRHLCSGKAVSIKALESIDYLVVEPQTGRCARKLHVGQRITVVVTLSSDCHDKFKRHPRQVSTVAKQEWRSFS